MPALFLTVHVATDHIHLVLGTQGIASKRCQQSLTVGARPIVIAPPDACLHDALQDKIERGAVTRLSRPVADGDLTTLGRAAIDHVVDAVFITQGGMCDANTHVAAVCRKLRIPVNVTDAPSLCTFTLPALYEDGPLQIGITTSGMGCMLAGRIQRHLRDILPPKLGQGIERLGAMRRRLIDEDARSKPVPPPAPTAADGVPADPDPADLTDDEAPAQPADFNQLVTRPDASIAARRRRWFAQICEHWPLAQLATIRSAEIDALLASYDANVVPAPPSPPAARRGRIILAGAGPGSPSLLTRAAHRAIQSATFVLADKLVPEPVLETIPHHTPRQIAKKFPGNADAAQQEFLDIGLKAAQKGHTVLRLKQGDPYLYGRGGEEVAWFRKRGFEPVVIPGVTSALAAPLAAGIPLTHRGVADDVRIVTGRGEKGFVPVPPGYVASQTVVALMVLGRLGVFVRSLVGREAELASHESTTNGNARSQTPMPPLLPKMTYASPLWPPETPCAVVQRAACADQRVVRTTLQYVVRAFAEVGSRPPELLILGRACEVLRKGAEKEEGVLMREGTYNVLRRGRDGGDEEEECENGGNGGGEEEGRREEEEVVKERGEANYVIEEGGAELDAMLAEMEVEVDLEKRRGKNVPENAVC